MDANRLSYLILGIIAVTAAGCGNNGPKTVKSAAYYGQGCVQQVKDKSFLVEWTDVPQQYAKKKLHPQSHITRFTNIEKQDLENTILKSGGANVVNAEHEFYVTIDKDNLKPQSNLYCDATILPAAWGPADINLNEAWNVLGKQGESVTVAVVDSGVDIFHQYLSSQIWTNSKEIPSNGIDDDQNGFIDDYKGYNFNAMSSDVTDDVGHGTHVSGIIAGQPGANGFTGIAPKAKIMPLKFMDSTGSGSVGDAIIAIDYAVNQGARVINASWGGGGCSDLLRQEISKATSHGIVFAAAAGNDGNDISVPGTIEWPAAFQIPGKITVASVNLAHLMSTFSNFGPLVDLAAPGESIVSTVPPDAGHADNEFCVKSGTSMATPFAAGVAALLFSARPNLNAGDIVDAMNSTVTYGHYGVRTQGRLNALSASQYLISH